MHNNDKDSTYQVSRLVDRFVWLVRSCPDRQLTCVAVHPETWKVLAKINVTDGKHTAYMGYGRIGDTYDLMGVGIVQDVEVEPMTIVVVDSEDKMTTLSVGYGMRT